MTRPWGGDPGDTYDREYYDPDPYRHDVPDPHRCSHPIDDHTYVDGGCAWLGCGCTWFDPASIPPDDPDHFDEVALVEFETEPEPADAAS